MVTTGAVNKVQDYERLRSQLELQRANWLADWRDLNDYILPRAGRFTVTDQNKGGKRTSKIVNSAATLAARVLSAGMMSGLTSPARSWFNLTVADANLQKNSAVQAWLYEVAKRMRDVFTKSNLYNVLPGMYADIGVFGTACMAVVEDEEDVIRCYRFPCGSYSLGVSARQNVDTFTRMYQRTARQLVQEFGEESCSSEVLNLYRNPGAKEQPVNVVHIVCPNADYNPKMLHAKFKRWTSAYYEVSAGQSGKLLKESGFDENPIMAARWQVDGDDVYGSGPGFDAIDDVKALQQLEKKKLRAIEKMVDPSLLVPSRLRGDAVSMLPGGITYDDEREGSKGVRPLHEVRFDVEDTMRAIAEHKQRIDQHFFADLFLLNASIQSGAQPRTAEEIKAIQQEKLLMLGPVTERTVEELDEPLIDRTFGIMHRRGMLPPAPVELHGVQLRVQCISVLATAQKLIGIGGVDRFIGVIGNMSGIKPEALDRLNVDNAIDFYEEALSVPPNILNSDEDVQKMRQARAQAQQAQQQQVDAQAQAVNAQTLSKTDTRGENALTDLLKANTGTPA